MISLGIAVLAGVFAVFLVGVIVDSSLLGLAMVLLVQFVAQTIGLDMTQIGSMHIGLGDVVGVILIFSGAIRFLLGKKDVGLTCLLLIGYVALVFFSMFRGVLAFGMQRAGNEAREFFFISACLVYFSTFSPSKKRIEQYFHLYLIFAVSLVLAAAARFAGLLPETTDPEQRLLPAMGAYSLCLAFLICLCWSYYGKAPRYSKWLAPIFGGLAIGLQHRTVWVVMIGMVVAALKMERSLLRRAFPYLAVTAVLVVGIGLTLYGRHADTRFYESATNADTLTWRIEGWLDLLGNKQQTLVTYLVGQPFGSGYDRYLGGTLVGAAAHDDYVSEFLRVGCAGLLLLLFLFIRPLRALYNRRQILSNIYPHPTFWVLFLLTILLWNFTYSLTYDQAAFTGMTVSIMMSISERSAAGEKVNFAQQAYASSQMG